MKLISNAKMGQPVESGSVFQTKIGTIQISIHRYKGCEGWFLTCRDLGIETMELKSEGLMSEVNESREILKKTVDKIQKNINTFCDSKIEIARY